MNHPQTTDLEIERARLLDQVDDVIRTAQDQDRPLSAEERAKIDGLNAVIDNLGDSVARSRSLPALVGTVIGGPNGSLERSLDELLWASSEYVTAGKISQSGGRFSPDPNGARNYVERAVIGYVDGATPVHAPYLHELRPEAHGIVRSFQQLVAEMQVFGLMVDRSTSKGSEGFEVARRSRQYADRWRSICRAMDVDTSGEGSNWVPTGIGASVHEKVRAMGKISPLFQRVDMPAGTWKWPIEGADATAYRVGEPTSDTESKMTASTPGTVAPTFDAEILGARVLVSRSLDADSAVAIVPFVTNKIARAHAIAEERAILDGDSDGTHQDTDVSGTADARTLWDGLRKRALAETSQALTSTTAANLATLRSKMGKWGLDPADCAIILGIRSFYALLGDSNLLTVDKFGPNATILAGQLGSVHGIPVIVSEYVREDLNATGTYDGITTTKTYYLCVNRSEWAMGQRMALEIEVDDSIYRETYQRVLVGFQREDFQSLADASTNDDTAIGFNVTAGS